MSDETQQPEESGEFVAEWEGSDGEAPPTTQTDEQTPDPEEQKRIDRNRRRVQKRRQGRRRRRNRDYNKAMNSVPGRGNNPVNTPSSSKLTGEPDNPTGLTRIKRTVQRWAHRHKLAFSGLLLGAGALVIGLILLL